MLEPRHGDGLGRVPALVPDDVVVHLSRAEHEARHPLAVGGRVVEQGPELALGEVVRARGGLLQPQEPLRGHHDEGPGGRVERLTPQQVEVLRRRRAVHDSEVLLRGELEEALEPGARVLRPVSLVAVRQQQRQP